VETNCPSLLSKLSGTATGLTDLVHTFYYVGSRKGMPKYREISNMNLNHF
jgi:hypothetical protein